MGKPDQLQKALLRMQDALERVPRKPRELQRAAKGPRGLPAGAPLAVLALAFFAAAILTGNAAFFVPALILAAIGGAMALAPSMRQLMGAAPHPDRASVGMGAEISSSATLEPGSSVEMGATVGARAVVRSGAVVRMGATLHAGAIVEKDAVVSWGADIHEDAVVGEGAVVGAGCDVHEGARIPPRMRLMPGSDFRGAKEPSPPAIRPPERVRDPREERLQAACARLEAELRASPDQVRGFLGHSGETVATLRRACEEMLERERELRAESDPAALARLAEERVALERRMEAQPDVRIRTSLQGAIAAIDEQRRQRDQLRLGAERLDAEHTRLLYTLEGLGSQFVRLRSAGTDVGRAPQAELERGVEQLRAELDAITEALETVSMPRALAEAPATGAEESTRPPGRDRTTSG